MSKKKKKETVFVIEEMVKPFVITSASIKEELCAYSYEIKTGVGVGFTHNVKGTEVIHEDMRCAFERLNVHLALIDDVFKHSAIEVEQIGPAMENHELTANYSVSGFKIKGNGKDESVILIGTKYVTAGGHIGLETPRVPLDNMSSYTWYNELKEAVDEARHEVELYQGGKFIPSEPKETNVQLSIGDMVTKHEDNEFENAAV